eukprot:TRINITY_DN67335_c0_g1_i1.p1 TRINITY_DN67335_c0_g1~~TRINITY_DN67335_c0_g1_i1.p1  ORF type:complete len:268 (-),score=19.61 TRINITY_DN67335_c0_g1_i1:480-1256(-)
MRPNKVDGPPVLPIVARSDLDSSSQSMSSNVGIRPSRIEGLPALPSVVGSDIDISWARGPHATCNFLLPGVLLAGSFPGDRSEPEHSQKIAACLHAGVNTFICLQQESELSRFTPYMGRATEIYATMSSDAPLEFLKCEIPDGHITSKESLTAAISTIAFKIKEGRVVYVHCWGGHGRTGTLLCAFLVKVYGLTVDEAKAYFMATHSQRELPRNGYWPHGRAQYEQVRSFEEDGPLLSDHRLVVLEEWEADRKSHGRK